MLAPALLALVTAALGGRAYLRWAPVRALDIPNARSSHTRPTPRGGGVVIVAGFLVGLIAWISLGGSVSPRALGWLAGALLVAVIGFVDDLRSLPALPRLATQLFAALLLTAVGVQQRDPLFLLALPLAFLYVVVVTNVYNFMDGIDGLAASQAVIAGAALAAAGTAIVNPLLQATGILLAASSAGFLVWNRPPARLFMGDVGSTFLGYSFAGLCLLGNIGVGGGRLPLEFDVVLLAPFLFDALVTLARRIARGERWYAAHRSHYYQRLVQRGLSHGQVTGLYAALAVFAATAALAGLGADPPQRELLVLLAYLPMLLVIGLVWRLESSGRPPGQAAKQPNEAPTVVTQGHC
jgi:UDP-N-acetylmuramyl pentapeptide phosphotransferase/UDP-N-acetylglucosamine-1-phosphate transferase